VKKVWVGGRKIVCFKYPQNRIEIGKMMTSPEYPEYHKNWIGLDNIAKNT
jgi:hypothetical protein